MASADEEQQDVRMECDGGEQECVETTQVVDTQQSTGGSQLAVPDGPPVADGPQRLTIGTQKAFERNYPYSYEKKIIDLETIYVCTKGSEWARTDEVLVLRCAGHWTAFDSAVSADGSTLQCRQPVFRCLATDITQPGWHNWQTKYAASPTDAGLAIDWQGKLWAETRVP